jgi:hypothetical protein
MSQPEAEPAAGSSSPPIYPYAERAEKSGDDPAPVSAATRRLPWFGAALGVVLFAILNCVAVPFAETIRGPDYSLQQFIFAVGLGLMGGQVGALTCALVWSPHRFLVRSMVLWLVGLVLYLCWFVGLLTVLDDGPWREDFRLEIAQAVAASLPAVSLALQLPQWLARLYFGWRLEPPDQELPSDPPASLSIRDMFIGTTVAALTMMALRFSLRNPEGMTTVVWIGWAIAAGVLMAVSVLILLPLIVLILRGYRALWAIAFMALAPAIAVGAFIYVVMQLEPNAGGPPGEVLVVMFTAGTTCIATTSLPLWLFRAAGYRLKIGSGGT